MSVIWHAAGWDLALQLAMHQKQLPPALERDLTGGGCGQPLTCCTATLAVHEIVEQAQQGAGCLVQHD